MKLLERLGLVRPADRPAGGADPATAQEREAAVIEPDPPAAQEIARAAEESAAEETAAMEGPAMVEEAVAEGTVRAALAGATDSASDTPAAEGAARPGEGHAPLSGEPGSTVGESESAPRGATPTVRESPAEEALAGAAPAPHRNEGAPGAETIPMVDASPAGEEAREGADIPALDESAPISAGQVAEADAAVDRPLPAADERAPAGKAATPVGDRFVPFEREPVDGAEHTDFARVVAVMSAAIREAPDAESPERAGASDVGTLPCAFAIDTAGAEPDNQVYQEALAHGRRTEEIARALFALLGDLHGLDERWREVLALAARFHDVGLVGGRRRHHRMSMRLIDTDPDMVADERLRPYVALLARYHRKAVPSKRHERFGTLRKGDRRALRRCVVLLRLASALARAVPQGALSFEAEFSARRVLVTVSADAPLERAVARARRWRGIFQRCYGRGLDILAAGAGAVPGASGPSDPAAAAAPDTLVVRRESDVPPGNMAHGARAAREDG